MQHLKCLFMFFYKPESPQSKVFWILKKNKYNAPEHFRSVILSVRLFFIWL